MESKGKKNHSVNRLTKIAEKAILVNRLTYVNMLTNDYFKFNNVNGLTKVNELTSIALNKAFVNRLTKRRLKKEVPLMC